MSIIFIAVQCFQCSTMQVKQQKKSSNKWNCVVCNEKQSVRKIFARGFLAKEVRKFVQGFNMSRQFSSEVPLVPFSMPKSEAIAADGLHKRKRSDWTEYLESCEEEGGEEGSLASGSALEPTVEIVTELPKDLLENRRTERRKQSLKPSFSKRKRRQQDLGEGVESEFCSRKMPCQVSKWNSYLDVEDGLIQIDEENAPCSWGGGGTFERHYDAGQSVEEEIHPDFA